MAIEFRKLDGEEGVERSIPTFQAKVFPKTLSNADAVRIAYHHELGIIVKYIKNGLSVLVECDRFLTSYIYQYVCAAAGKEYIEDPNRDDYNRLPSILGDLHRDQVLILRSIDVINQITMIDLLYGMTGNNEHIQLLAFKDPALEINKVVLNRFHVPITLGGIPRYFDRTKTGLNKYALSYLITASERKLFKAFSPESLYKQVAGLNVISFRDALIYIRAHLKDDSTQKEIFDELRYFKAGSGHQLDIPKVSFDDIGGYDETKKYLKKVIQHFAEYNFEEEKKSEESLISKGFLLHGPPGTGKTMFAKAVANELNATILTISGPELIGSYVGESEKNLRQLFNSARRNAPSVILFDEFDSIAGKRIEVNSGADRAANALMAQLLTELDGFRREENILFIGTTNRINIIDQALLRPSRLLPIEIGKPDFEARKAIINIYLKSFGIEEILKKQYQIAIKHQKSWQKNRKDLPGAFLADFFEAFPTLKEVYQQEQQLGRFTSELRNLFEFLDEKPGTSTADASKKNGKISFSEVRKPNSETDLENQPSLELIRQKIHTLIDKYSIDMDHSTPSKRKGDSSFEADLRSLLTTLDFDKKSKQKKSPQSFVDSIVSLLSEHTDGFNNDEIKSIFKDSSFDFKMNSQFISVRYLGRKIGLVKKKMDESKAIHIQ